MRARNSAVALLCFALTLGVAHASWYDDYDAGIAAAKKGQWSTVVSKMSAAIKGNAKEGSKTRTYGAIFINYHPFYYRGVANMNLGNYDQAISDLEKAEGPGELDLGSIESLMQRAKSKLEAENTPAQPEPPAPTRPATPAPTQPTPTPTPVTPNLTQPATPTIDPAVRQRAEAAIANARTRVQAAQQRRATAAPEYAQALRAVTDATTRSANARTTDDYRAVIGLAENAAFLADSAQAPAAAPATPTPAPAVPTTTIPTRPAAAADAVLADPKRKLREALESYFRGDFDEAERAFRQLTRELPRNAWVWAFLGASQYSQYAFEADEQYRTAAMQSFREAKRLGKWRGGLPDRYFSRRIRRAFESAS